MAPIDPHIFRAYDIRGKAASQLTPDACEQIGKGFGTALRRMYKKDHPTVVVGRDARTHSPLLEDAVIKGLTSTGCAVSRIGQTPSPLNYFTICEQKFDAGVQVTASHNPKDDNGLKLQLREAEAYSGDDLQRLREQIERQDFVTGEGSVADIDAVTPYQEHLLGLFGSVGEGKTIVVDCGNGVTGPVNGAILRGAGASLIGLFLEPDGNFPNHQPDPSKHDTLKDLQKKVVETNADFGIAFDGDGDRVGIVDETGRIRSADEILLLLAKDHLRRNPGAPVIFTVSNSETLNTEVARWGGRPVMCKVGHSFVEHAMRAEGARLGGEQSGHFFCGEGYYGFDDALAAALRILAIFQESGTENFSALFAEFPAVHQAHERRPHCPDAEKTRIVRELTESFAKTHPVNTLDGARVDFGDGAWAGIRQSNTSPCLSVCIEARSTEKLAEVEAAVLAELRKHPEIDLEA
jgi:phosphomannomutase/phosphoglucomutase